MADLEKVIYSIERFICHVPDACRDCGYDIDPYPACEYKLMQDALELLKAKEAIPPKMMDTAIPVSKTAVRFVKTYWCGECGEAVEKSYRFCPKCGRAVKLEA